MNDLFAQQLGTGVTVGSILIASLIGSPHCGAMCGGFAALAGSSSLFGVVLYNSGRLITYTILGALAGSIGAALNLGGEHLGFAHVAALLVGLLMVLIGVSQLLRTSHRHASSRAQKLFVWFEGRYLAIMKWLPPHRPYIRSVTLGALSTLLPCGWLYSFATVAASTGSPSRGAALMFVFWLGSLPILVGVGSLSRFASKSLTPYLPRVVPFLFILAGGASIYVHFSHVHSLHCH